MTQQTSNPAAGTPAVVDVYADAATNGAVSFSHEWRWQDGSSQGKGTIDIPKRAAGDPGTPIHFHLHDNSGRGLDFADDDLKAIWVKRSGCPDEPSSDDQIPGDGIKVAPNLLKIFNENSEECTLHYRLRFRDKSGNMDSYDPDIKNGGKS